MTIRNFAFLVYMCLIASSCENTVFENNISATQLTTRSIPDDFTNYNSYFLVLSFIDNTTGKGSTVGTLKSYGQEVEYHFAYFVDSQKM